MNNVSDCTKEDWDAFLLETKEKLEKSSVSKRLGDVNSLIETAKELGDTKLVQELTHVKESLTKTERPVVQSAVVVEKIQEPEAAEVTHYRESITTIIESLWKITEGEAGSNISPGTLEFLELRAIICDIRSLEAEYWEKFNTRIPKLTEAIDTANQVKAILGDNNPCVFLTSSFNLKSADWRELAVRYRVLVQARAAMDWFIIRGDCLTDDQSRRLLDSIGGAQQAFKRRIELYNMRDYFQRDLYEAVKSASRAKHYLKALVSHTTIEEILHLASDLDNAFEDAFSAWRKYHAEHTGKADAVKSRNEILLELKTLVNEPQFSAPKNREANKKRLFDSLQKWRIAKFPVSDVELREILLEHLDTFLKDSKEYSDVYTQGLLERERREVKAPEQANISQIRKVAALTKGKRILIFGSPVEGSLERNLQKLLSADSVVLLSSQENLPTIATVRQHDIVIVFSERLSGKFQQELEKTAKETPIPIIQTRNAQSLTNLVNALEKHYTNTGDLK